VKRNGEFDLSHYARVPSNIYRPSGSSPASVSIAYQSEMLILSVENFGKGTGVKKQLQVPPFKQVEVFAACAKE
jgi:hypothetical protein